MHRARWPSEVTNALSAVLRMTKVSLVFAFVAVDTVVVAAIVVFAVVAAVVAGSCCCCCCCRRCC